MSFPNQLTVLRIVLTPAFAIVLVFEGIAYKYTSLGIFVLASLTDWYDGYAARKMGKITPAGKYLDPLADKLMTSTAFGVFTYIGYVPFWMFAIIVGRDVFITGLRSYALSSGKRFETSILAKWKTFSQMVAIYLLFFWMIAESSTVRSGSVAHFVAWVKAWDLVGKMMLFVTFFTLTTGIGYLYENRRHLKSLAIAFYRVFVPTNVR